MDSYSKLQIFEKQLTGVTLGLTPHDEWAAKCLLCFGPENQDEKAQHGEAYVCLCMDGNFSIVTINLPARTLLTIPTTPQSLYHLLKSTTMRFNVLQQMERLLVSGHRAQTPTRLQKITLV
ncbi:hypothetical protein H4Q26_015369 [Puccinia striiformis f. sp. tritici PST-130]|nr:hypothetical protein H4Q26_015369 [Puccinia striiformis f. sp. tritici PST-130]